MSTFFYKKQGESKYLRLHYIAMAQVVGLFLLLLPVYIADQRYSQHNVENLAKSTAHIVALKDASFRNIFIKNGGAYLPVSDELVQDPSLALRTGRDIETPDGTAITLVSPKKLLHMARGLQSYAHGTAVVSDIKMLIPLPKEDAPDEWEAQAIRSLQQGEPEVSIIVQQDGQQVLRYMYPVLATNGCLKNRIGQGYELGDVIGGLCVTVPLGLFSELRQDHTRRTLALYGSLFLFGVVGVFFSFRKTIQRDAIILNAQKATQDAHDELEKTFDAIDDIITIQDQDMRITRVNRATCEAFSAKPEDLVGKYCYEVFRGAHKPCDGCPEIDSLADGIRHQSEVEHKNLNKIFAVAASPIVGDEGEIAKLVHYAKDITESRHQELQLRQAQKMEAIGTLAGGIAHDFNNILTAIMGYSELAQMHPSIDSEVSKDLDQIHLAGMRAKELVQQILTFSRQNEQDFQPLDVQRIVQEALKLLRASIPAIINFDIDILNGRGLVIADATQVHQVVLNLCTNAYHAMRDSGGTLKVSLYPIELTLSESRKQSGLPPGTYLRLVVCDTGRGIDKKDLERIFEPYFTTKKKGEGTGLGLSLVHGIVRSIGGDIWVTSEKNRGATFQVDLPILTEVIEEEHAIDDTVAPMPTGDERILIVDDEESIIRMEKRTLERLGYSVTSFADPIQAKLAFEGRPYDFDLVITDMNMPNLSGLELIEFIQKARSEMPIVISTGFSEQVNGKAMEKYGLKKIMMKPLVLQEFAQVVRDALD